MKRNVNIEKVVEFAQSESTSKQFRHDYPISDETKEEMLLNVYNKFTKYMVDLASEEYYPILKEFIDDHNLPEDKWEALVHNLFWWKVIYESDADKETSYVEIFIDEHYDEFRNKPLMTSWLREWDRAIPKFYFVGHKHSDNVLVLVDILTQETLDVIVYDPTAFPPEKGEIVMGTLIPIGDALYFPIIDFYHFDVEVSGDLIRHINYYYEKHSECTLLEAFIHVLSAALQIEHIILTENQEHIPSE
ncbi:hypothetical protein [Virgibacillus doumboii]|uniref:hypothetical protein n=1 Tax=Virgibacillus doumboii TaxID=2697503 RepID=UPI0013E0647A|nr:hypothetical protein [Virgibacillus doumboii]